MERTMKYFLKLFILFLLVTPSFAGTSEQNTVNVNELMQKAEQGDAKAHSADQSFVVEKSIGSLILLRDRLIRYEDNAPSPSAKVFAFFKKEYDEHVKDLDVSMRIDYFWASMWHLDFGVHSMHEFLEIVSADCGEEFIQKLEIYIDKEREMRRNASRLEFTKNVHKVLLFIKESEALKK